MFFIKNSTSILRGSPALSTLIKREPNDNKNDNGAETTAA
jgi:hypothetical protein